MQVRVGEWNVDCKSKSARLATQMKNGWQTACNDWFIFATDVIHYGGMWEVQISNTWVGEVKAHLKCSSGNGVVENHVANFCRKG